MADLATPTEVSDLMLKLRREKQVAMDHQERKHDDWNDNYELYRNKVRTNRLTQRQAVNIPLMKETVKTILSKIDDPPTVDWKERSGDEMKEIIFQEKWNKMYKDNKLDWVDVLDKKNVLLYGLSTKILNVGDEGVEVSVLDNFDIIYDPLMSALDIETARFIVRVNIFRTIEEVLNDDRYDKKGKDKLKEWSASEEGMVQSEKNRELWERKNERLQAMGVQQHDYNKFSAGDVIINLSEHYSRVWDEEAKKYDRHVITYADDWLELQDELLKDLIGVEEYPFVVWFEDPETNDIYPDGIADLVRTPNKVINVWFSQQVENRTLQNFQMHWYDATIQGYEPQTYEPGPGRMLPAPGNPNETIKAVDVNGLDETFQAIDFLTKVVERGSGAVAIEKGVGESGSQTLGEVEILVGKAMERSVGMQKFYRGSWYELAVKWEALEQANPRGMETLYKSGKNGKIYEKKVTSKDWKSDAGYEPVVSSTSEQEINDLKTIQKFNFVMSQSPNNVALRKIAMKRELEMLDLTPDELKEIQEAEENLPIPGTNPEELVNETEKAAGISGVDQTPVDSPAPQGEEAALLQGIESQLQQL